MSKLLYKYSIQFYTVLLLVSCSAGIGRTGVLVAMETAMCLIERNEPVYPLDIVQKMRDHRAMMVQTSVSEKNRSLFYLYSFFLCFFYAHDDS